MGLLFGARPGTAVAARPDGAAAKLRDLWGISSAADLIPQRPARGPAVLPYVSQETALRHSAVWACLRLRADIISTMPLDVYRRVNLGGEQIQIQAPAPPVLVNPGGDRVPLTEWLYSSQVDLDRAGNAIGLITKRDGNNLPAEIKLKSAANCSVRGKGGEIDKYRIDGELYDPAEVWHEKQFTVPGLPVGLSPVAYAALTVGKYLAVEQFAVGWFAGGGVPRARLRNTAKTLNQAEAAVVKESWRASIAAGEPFVHGNDWEYDLASAENAGMEWLEAEKASVYEIARYFGCPADLVDAIIQGRGNITYANVTQRNLQFLVLNIGPAVIRREGALSTLTPRPRYVKLNTDALLRMDPQTRADMMKTQIDSRTLTPDEARELDNRPPLTQDQVNQFLTFWPPKTGG
jgi:HK97 family phage portal protein